MQGISDVRYKRHKLETLESRGYSRDMQVNGDCGLDWVDWLDGGWATTGRSGTVLYLDHDENVLVRVVRGIGGSGIALAVCWCWCWSWLLAISY